MALREFVARQVDYTTQDCVIPAALNQGFDTLQPDSDIGFIIWSALSPNVVTYPILKNFIWAALNGSNIATGEFYYWSGTEWTLLNLEDGARILPGTVPISAFSVAGSQPSDIIQVNAAGNGYQFVGLVDAIPLGSIDLTKLKATLSDNGKFISVTGGVATYVTFDSAFVIGLIGSNSLPITKLVPGVGKQVLRTKADASSTEWAAAVDLLDNDSLPVAKLSGGGASNVGKVPRVGTDGLITLQIPTATRTQVKTSTVLPIPASGSPATAFAHGLGGFPTSWDAFLSCKTANNGYAVLQRIHHYEVTSGGSNDERPAFSVSVDAVNVSFVQLNYGPSTQRNFMNGSNGDSATFDPADWDLVLQATLVTT